MFLVVILVFIISIHATVAFVSSKRQQETQTKKENIANHDFKNCIDEMSYTTYMLANPKEQIGHIDNSDQMRKDCEAWEQDIYWLHKNTFNYRYE